jgi:muconate cycloisomerase
MSAMNTISAPLAAAFRIAPSVERVETLLVDLPTIRPHKLSVATMTGQTLMLVKIHCSDGFIGIGEGATIAGMA